MADLKRGCIYMDRDGDYVFYDQPSLHGRCQGRWGSHGGRNGRAIHLYGYHDALVVRSENMVVGFSDLVWIWDEHEAF